MSILSLMLPGSPSVALTTTMGGQSCSSAFFTTALSLRAKGNAAPPWPRRSTCSAMAISSSAESRGSGPKMSRWASRSSRGIRSSPAVSRAAPILMIAGASTPLIELTPTRHLRSARVCRDTAGQWIEPGVTGGSPAWAASRCGARSPARPRAARAGALTAWPDAARCPDAVSARCPDAVSARCPGAASALYPGGASSRYQPSGLPGGWCAAPGQCRAEVADRHQPAETSRYPDAASDRYPPAETNPYPDAASDRCPPAETNPYPDAASDRCPPGASNPYRAGASDLYPASAQVTAPNRPAAGDPCRPGASDRCRPDVAARRRPADTNRCPDAASDRCPPGASDP